MKCDKCGEDILVQRSKSANLCFNCGNKIVAGDMGDWPLFDNTKELLAYVAATYSIEALFARKHFSDHTSPMMPQEQKNLLKQAFECSAVQFLQDNMAADQQHKEIAVKQAIKKLTDLMFSREASVQIIWELTNAIGWEMPELEPEPCKRRSDVGVKMRGGKAARKTDAPIGSIYRFGGIDWKVLDADGDERLLISQDILEERAFNDAFIATSWEKCSLRKYLNNEFYNNFVPKDRARIVLHNVINDENPWWDTPGGGDTLDYFWLLSLEEVCGYFGDSLEQLHNREKRALARQLKRDYWDKEITKFDDLKDLKDFYDRSKIYVTDQYSSSRMANFRNHGASWWWLRSPGDNSHRAAFVLLGGGVHISGSEACAPYGGVRPALWLNL